MADLAVRLARELPDLPRWIDVRGMLLSGHAQVFGGTTAAAGFAVRVRHGAMSAVAVVGRPPAAAIREAAHGTTAMTPIVAQVDNADEVARALSGPPRAGDPSTGSGQDPSTGSGQDPSTGSGQGAPGWKRERAILHLVPKGKEEKSRPSPPGDLQVRLLAPDDPLDHLPPGLRFEMTHARELAPVAAVFDGERPVSFCYPVWRTEGLWDVSIDTLEAYRGRGLAAHAVAAMTDRMRREGREPMWGAIESNGPSLRLAARLGFAPIDEAVVFARGPWAYLTAGFEG